MRLQYLRGLYKREQGSALIQFAVVLPVVLLLVMGILEFALVMFGETLLEGATNYAGRLGSTSYINTGTTGACPSPSAANPQSQSTYIYCIIGQRVSPLLSQSNLQVSAMTYTEGTAVSYQSCTNGTPGGGTPACASDFGQPGALVLYTVQYPWQIVTPLLQNVLGTNGIFMLSSSVIVKNEPFPKSN